MVDSGVNGLNGGLKSGEGPSLNTDKKRPTEVQSADVNKLVREDYFLSSALPLHFSHFLPSFLASTQHLCSHSLPAAFAFSQQDCFFLPCSFLPSSAMTVPATNVNAQTAINNDLMSFINLLSLPVFNFSRGLPLPTTQDAKRRLSRWRVGRWCERAVSY